MDGFYRDQHREPGRCAVGHLRDPGAGVVHPADASGPKRSRRRIDPGTVDLAGHYPFDARGAAFGPVVDPRGVLRAGRDQMADDPPPGASGGLREYSDGRDPGDVARSEEHTSEL